MKDTEAGQSSHEPLRETANTLRKPLAKMSMGTSPVATLNMVQDWALHLTTAPDKQIELMRKAHANWASLFTYVAQGCPTEPQAQPITPARNDRRFRDESWSKAPFAAWAQAFLLAEDFMDAATSDVPGLHPGHDKAMTFLVRQMMDAVAPSNFLATNPEALAKTFQTRGMNLLDGGASFYAQVQETLRGEKPGPAMIVGEDVAVTEGKVVLRTHLMELIQYKPRTPAVHPEPILIVPAWIMKYYILDLSPKNSMIKHLTEQGFTVFAISWRNPDENDADLGMEDYLAQGPLAAIEHITQKTKSDKVHSVGYCLGGTLLSIAAAKMAREKDDRLASMTLLAAQTDFSQAGELMLFINESQVSFLEDVMTSQGYLEADQMMSAFQMLRSNDLIWSQMVRQYLLGEDAAPMNDLMSWNADTTRMPARMHSEYLRKMFLNNDLASGRYKVDGHSVSLRDIRIPVFAVGTETDHIAPWTSVFKIHNVGHADVTFVLTNGGHNAGVVSEPGHPRRRYRIRTTRDTDPAPSADEWLDIAELNDGSWWIAWTEWFAAHSSPVTKPPRMTGSLGDAPGTYVRMT